MNALLPLLGTLHLTGRGGTDVGRGRLAAVIAGTTLMVGAVSGCDEDPQAAPELGVCDLAVDVTGYPGSDWSIVTIQAGVEELKSTCFNRVLTANLITDYSKSNACPKPRVNTNPGDLTNDPKEDRLRAEAWESFGQQLEVLINCGVYGVDADPTTADKLELEGSDVFGAIQVSEELMNGIPTPHTLFILSDMMNTMPPMRTPPKAKVSKAISSLEKDGVIPDLDGAEVVVVGSGTSDKQTPAENAKMTKFWNAYFEAANAGETSFRQTIS